jgi:hypothetical protein
MRGSIIALAAVLAAAPAGALDTPSGTYQGKATCRSIVGGVASKTKHEVTLNVAGAEVGVVLDMTGTAEFAATGSVDAVLAADAEKTDRGAFAGASCGTGGGDATAVHGELVIKSSGKASVKGTVLRSLGSADDVRICTFKAKRTSVSVPPIIPCTPLP